MNASVSVRSSPFPMVATIVVALSNTSLCGTPLPDQTGGGDPPKGIQRSLMALEPQSRRLTTETKRGS